jgi:hypothetical protein
MPLLARLVNNRLGWEKPSGVDCKAINPDAPLFEVQYGFGFEEWLYDPTHHAPVDGENYYFGYLQGFHQPEHLIDNEIYLFNEMYNHGNALCMVQTKRIVGRISGVEVINQDDFNQIQNHIDDWSVIMRQQLEQALAGHPNIDAALNMFDAHKENNELFNVKYLIGSRFNLPRHNQNWNILNINHGIQQVFPGNFQIANIPQNLIQEYLALNGGRIPQVLNANNLI